MLEYVSVDYIALCLKKLDYTRLCQIIVEYDMVCQIMLEYCIMLEYIRRCYVDYVRIFNFQCYAR